MKYYHRIVFLTFVWLIWAFATGWQNVPLFPLEDRVISQDARIVLLFGSDVRATVSSRILALIQRADRRPVEVHESLPEDLPLGSLILSFGDTQATRMLMAKEELSPLGSEGFIVRSGQIDGILTVATDGNSITPDPFHQGNLGLHFGAYALLEALGFAFLHPLAPMIPDGLKLQSDPVHLVERPYWPIRMWHLHTMHPLELTDVLNGWGLDGPQDLAGWESMLPDWERFLEWMLANRQNRAEWVLLMSASWQDFADSTERQRRLYELVSRAHAWGIAIGIDAAIALQQQHAFLLIRDKGDLEEELAQMRDRIDWLMAAGFDFMTTESGTSEFTHPDDERMLTWMNEFARYLDEAYGAPAYIKVHISSGQTTEHYTDPETQEPLNFNFLPHYADPRLGVFPHTVQHYALDDPAPTYGNSDFSEMRRFLQMEAGIREVIWYPETAYWVSFDVDVPLFLPIYAQRRFHDLRLIAFDEIEGRTGRGEYAGARVNGQSIFSSGWEWGFWFNDVVSARAAWNPFIEEPNEMTAFRKIVSSITRAFGDSSDLMTDLLLETVQRQHDLLIQGKIDGVPPDDVVRRNGQAYLQGFETWDDWGAILPNAEEVMTQPVKLSLLEMRRRFLRSADYKAEVKPLLAEMESAWIDLADRFAALAPLIQETAKPLYNDFVDAARMTALRSVQVHGLYDYVDGIAQRKPAMDRLMSARQALDEASEIVKRREIAYRVEPERIAGWRDNPSAYEFTYLWTVRSLFFWWRDEGLAVDAPKNPCYLNIIHPLDIVFGDGRATEITRRLRQATEPLRGYFSECLAEPATEPLFPQDSLRNQPYIVNTPLR